ncbi:MAG: peptidoglycan-binding protein [Prevotellaceae bacterium]|nr:peptidoglycan-binding protein [Prevotellaceae bacterium]
MKKILITFIKKWEGGFSNNPNDNGGATMKGVTIGTFTAYRKSKGLPAPSVEDLKNISDAEWEEIFTTYYWKPCKADSINNVLNACVLVSWAWGSGVTGAVLLFQRNYGLTQDGVIGAKTIAKLESAKFSDLCKIREKYFNSIGTGSQATFLKGWLNRLNDFVKTFSPFA